MAEYAIRIEQRPEYLVAHVTGDFSSDSGAMKAWLGVARAMRESGQGNVLVLRGTGTLGSDLWMSTLVHALSDLGFEIGRGAVVLLEAPERSATFIEPIAAQRGTLLRQFPDEQSADSFLRGD